MHKNRISRRKINIEKINKEAIKNTSELIAKSEAYYYNQVEEILTAITCPKSKIKLLLIGGPSSAGKTTTSKIIKAELKKRGFSSIIISLDDFYINRSDTPKFQDGSYDFENITTLDLPLLNAFIDDLLTHHKAQKPIFNFLTGERSAEWETIKIDDHTILTIEGLHALNPKLIKSHKREILKIYLSLNANFNHNGNIIMTAKKVRLLRRITRDFYTRGYTVLETLNNWKNVLNGEEKWVKPFKKAANYVIDSVHDYELLLYAKYSKPILKELILESNVKKLFKNKHYSDKKPLLLNTIYLVKELYEGLTCADELNKEVVPKNSLLMEFIDSAEDIVEPLGKIFK